MGQIPQLVQQIFGRPIEAHINYGFFLQLRGLQKIEAKEGRQAAGIVMPEHIIPDE
jgi:hypothetical protein